jgi:pSer/pThr/pTyr-binding forkhead associated (FHA) protein
MSEVEPPAPLRIPNSSSRNAVNFSSARTTKPLERVSERQNCSDYDYSKGDKLDQNNWRRYYDRPCAVDDIVIDDPTVSARHASLTNSPSGYRLRDLGSTNGTLINGVFITDAELKDSAEIRFGYVTGVFRDATARIAQARESQVSSEHDRPARIRVLEMQAIFYPLAQ